LARDWSGAEAHFAACAELAPEDRPTRLFRDLTARWQAQAPAADWDGILEIGK
jgi:hypothetical protein